MNFFLVAKMPREASLLKKMNNPMTYGNSDTAEACFDDWQEHIDDHAL